MLYNSQSPIGIYDSGVGGLTVLRELRARLPGENILYFGDSANCPFGNRDEKELTAITNRIFSFFRDQDVKLTVSACNTTSALFQLKGEPDIGFRVLSIIEPISHKIARLGLDEVGVIATEFTISSGIYEKLIRRENPDIRVWGQYSRNLARLVDNCLWDEIPAEVEACAGALLGRHPLDHIILACTHYPIVREQFCRVAPGVTFLDPAQDQALAAERLLAEKNLQNTGSEGTVRIYTSGDPALFEEVAGRLGFEDTKIERLTL